MTTITSGASYKIKTTVNDKPAIRSARVKEIKPRGRGEQITYTVMGETYSVGAKKFLEMLA